MRLFLLASLTMCAFAANSILTRLAVDGGHSDPNSFAILRVLAGAVVLVVLVRLQSGDIRWKERARLVGAVSLAVYMIGFSLAYVSLDAGLGALILFGVVQISMFLFGALRGARPSARQLLGASVAFVGLVIALWPGEGESAGAASGAVAMVLAGLGWAAYTISGKSASQPLAATAANFCICLPIMLIVLLPFVQGVSFVGVVLAAICGGVTSGLGYALWYRVLPHLQQAVAAVVQLSVPIIAILGGVVFLGETVTSAILIATALVVCGIGLAVTSRPAPTDRS